MELPVIQKINNDYHNENNSAAAKPVKQYVICMLCADNALRWSRDGGRREDLQQHAARRLHDRNLGGHEPRYQVGSPSKAVLMTHFRL